MLELELLSQKVANSQQHMNKLQDQIDYMRGEFNSKFSNKT
jgi:uncharacterized coiled-coil protein SlyX